MLVVGIDSFARSGIGEVADLLATVHYISRGAAIWDPPKSVKRPFDVYAYIVFLNASVGAARLWDSNPRLWNWPPCAPSFAAMHHVLPAMP